MPSGRAQHIWCAWQQELRASVVATYVKVVPVPTSRLYSNCNADLAVGQVTKQLWLRVQP